MRLRLIIICAVMGVVLLSPLNLYAQSIATPTPVLGQIVFNLKDADGKSLKPANPFNIAFSVHEAQVSGSDITLRKFISIPSGILGHLIPDQPVSVPPGTYVLREVFDNRQPFYVGYPLPKTSLLFEVKAGEIARREISLGELEILFSYHDQKPVKNIWFMVFETKIDANGNPFPGIRFDNLLPLMTGETGRANIKLTPGKYLIWLYERNTDIALSFSDHISVVEILPGQRRTISLTTGRIDYVPRNLDGSLNRQASAAVYKTERDANGEPLLPRQVKSTVFKGPDQNGVISFDLLPGIYTLFTNSASTGQNLDPDFRVEPMRYLVSDVTAWAIPEGHFFTQTGANRGGFVVTNRGGVSFWDDFERLGGVETLGYPTSHRFLREGEMMQAFQKALLVWDTENGEARFWPVLEQISFLKGEFWLNERQVPSAVVFGWEDETLELLDFYPEVKEKFFANPYWQEQYGYPAGSAEFDAFIAVRTTNAVFQLWKVDMPWAKAGEVTLLNVGDLAKEAGIVPPEAATPGPPN